MSSTGLNLLNLTSSSATSGSGIDVTSVVAQILDAERAPERLLQSQQSTLQTQASVLSSLKTGLNALSDKINDLGDFSGALDAMKADSSNTAILTASAQSSAASGSHLVQITSLATTASYYTDPVTSSDGTIQSGTITLQLGSDPSNTKNITVDSSNNKLDSLVTFINKGDYGVRASVINDADGARLALVSKTTGAPGNITVTANTTGLGFNRSSTGLNASLSVDGVPVHSASNTVSGAIPGVTLNLNSAPLGAEVVVNVAPDSERATQAISDFVAAYNSVITAINAQSTFNTTTNTAGPLSGDSTLRSLQSSLLTDVTYAISGNNGLVNLSSIGVKMENDGTLSIDSGELNDAIANNFADVQNLFQATGDTNGWAVNFMKDLAALTDTTSGAVNVELTQNAASQKDISRQISDIEDRLTARQQVLIQQYSQVDTLLREYPIMMSQINSELATLPSNTKSS